RHVAGICRRVAAALDRGGNLLRRNLLQDSASRSPAKAGAAAASSIMVRLRQRRDSAADRPPRNGRPVRVRGRPQSGAGGGGALSRGTANGAAAWCAGSAAARGADDRGLLP